MEDILSDFHTLIKVFQLYVSSVVINLFSSTNITVALLLASEHTHNRTSTDYKHLRDHYPISKEYGGDREHQVENPALVYTLIRTRSLLFIRLLHTRTLLLSKKASYSFLN
jgi:hypothetical protein